MREFEYMSLGGFIAKRRRFLRLTQEQLAEKIHVSKSAVAKWETDGGIPDRDNLRTIADVLDVTVDVLYRMIECEGEKPFPIQDINVTEDIIAVLESYGYKVIPPETETTKNTLGGN